MMLSSAAILSAISAAEIPAGTPSPICSRASLIAWASCNNFGMLTVSMMASSYFPMTCHCVTMTSHFLSMAAQ
jgi:hypothetical protein